MSTCPLPPSCDPACRLLCIWDLEAKAPASEAEGGPAAKRARSAVPPQMLFQHAGHRVRHRQGGRVDHLACTVCPDAAGLRSG